MYLDSSPQYEALSYCWGDTAKPRKLYTNRGTINITESLFSALCTLRYFNGSRRLWADALCINQEDVNEKKWQVSLMGQIYQQARSCLIYLGPGFRDHTLVQPLLRGIASDSFSGAEGQVSRSQATEIGPPPFHSQAWIAFRELLCSPWFSRKWTIQECVLPSHVVVFCGSWNIEWDILAKAVQKASNRRTPLVTTGDAFRTLRAQSGAENVIQLGTVRDEILLGNQIGLLENLLRFRTREATDPRDHLFALLSVSSEGADPAFIPDYGSTLNNVMSKAAVKFVIQGNYLG
jgi:hypothetical protein